MTVKVEESTTIKLVGGPFDGQLIEVDDLEKRISMRDWDYLSFRMYERHYERTTEIYTNNNNTVAARVYKFWGSEEV